MSFFISEAVAEAGSASQAPSAMSWVFLAVMFLALYFILIRPQQKRAKDHGNLISQLAKGDEIVTTGGLLGRITKVGDNFLTVEIAKDIEITVQRHAIQSLMPKGTIKSV